MGVKKEDGIVPMEERLVAADISRYKLVRKNWFAYNPMRLNIGSIARWQGESDVLVSPDYVVFRCLERSLPATLLPEYFDSFLSSRQWNAFVREAGDGGVRIRIYYRDIAQLQLALPDVKEQQKIADCLGSLDKLIAIEDRKLDALQQHKQGLMQQLFPVPGETTPRLRFPEFRGSGAWETKKLGNFITRGKETFDPQTQRNTLKLIELENIESQTGKIFGISELGKHKSLKTKFQPGDVLFGKLRPYLRKFARPEFHGVCTSEIWVLRSKVISNDFLFYLVQTERFIQLTNISSGSRMPRADWHVVAGADFEIPYFNEQQKIAQCLDTLDNLIAVVDRKLEALRLHKQGLMQQLFPLLDLH